MATDASVLRKAKELLRRGRGDEALHLLDNAASLARDAESHVLRVRCLLDRGAFRAAGRTAREAQTQSQEHETRNRRPKPDGQRGHIITPEPGRKSFKQALIAVVFVVITLEARAFAIAAERHGVDVAKERDRKKRLWQRLAALGITDTDLLDRIKKLCDTRNEIVHEKPLGHERVSNLPTAQDAAREAIVVLDAVKAFFTEGGSQRA